MSLGAIDFGLIVDGAVVLVENVVRTARRARGGATSRSGRSRAEAAPRGGPTPITFGDRDHHRRSIVPILTLGGVEGKMFKPMALHGGLRPEPRRLLADPHPRRRSCDFALPRGRRGHESEPRFVRPAAWALPARARRLLQTPRRSCGPSASLAVAAGGLLAHEAGWRSSCPRLDEGDIVDQRRSPGLGRPSPRWPRGTGRMERRPEGDSRRWSPWSARSGTPGAGDRPSWASSLETCS